MRMGWSMLARSPGLRLFSRVITFSPSLVSSNSLLCLLNYNTEHKMINFSLV